MVFFVRQESGQHFSNIDFGGEGVTWLERFKMWRIYEMRREKVANLVFVSTYFGEDCSYVPQGKTV